jgi:hypothetical protein
MLFKTQTMACREKAPLRAEVVGGEIFEERIDRAEL